MGKLLAHLRIGRNTFIQNFQALLPGGGEAFVVLMWILEY